MRREMIKQISQFLAVVALLAVSSCVPSEGKPPQLTKQDAIKLLEMKGYRDVSIGAIVHPGEDNSALVFGVGREPNGDLVKFHGESVLYDESIGWFDYEFTRTSRMRIWAVSAGYSEIYAKKNSLSDSELLEMLIGTWKHVSNRSETVTYSSDGTWKEQFPEKGYSGGGTWELIDGNLRETAHGVEKPYTVKILTISHSNLVLQIGEDTNPPTFFGRLKPGVMIDENVFDYPSVF